MPLICAATVAISVAFVANVVNAATSRAVPSSFTLPDHRKAQALLFVGSYLGGVEIYTQKEHLLAGELFNQDGPAKGIAVDAKGDLYIAGSNDPCIYVFPPPWSTPSECLAIGGPSVGVAIDSKGVVAAVIQPGGSRAASVELFAPGALTPCVAVEGPSFPTLTGRATFDKSGNLYVTDGNQVGKLSGGCKAKAQIADLGLTGLSNVGGLRVDPAGNIDALIFSASVNAINVYPPGVTSPSLTVPLNNIYEPTDFVFVNGGKNVWATAWNTAPDVFEFAFPGGGAPIPPAITAPQPELVSLAALPVVEPGGP